MNNPLDVFVGAVCLIIFLSVLSGYLAIKEYQAKKPKANTKCLNCRKAVPINGLCPHCHYNEITEKLES